MGGRASKRGDEVDGRWVVCEIKMENRATKNLLRIHICENCATLVDGKADNLSGPGFVRMGLRVNK